MNHEEQLILGLRGACYRVESVLWYKEEEIIDKWFPYATDIISISFNSKTVKFVVLSREGMHIADDRSIHDLAEFLSINNDVKS